jgi:hypothetical protein
MWEYHCTIFKTKDTIAAADLIIQHIVDLTNEVQTSEIVSSVRTYQLYPELTSVDITNLGNAHGQVIRIYGDVIAIWLVINVLIIRIAKERRWVGLAARYLVRGFIIENEFYLQWFPP